MDDAVDERELEEGATELAGVEEVVVPHTEPFITGISAGALPLLPWKPILFSMAVVILALLWA